MFRLLCSVLIALTVSLIAAPKADAQYGGFGFGVGGVGAGCGVHNFGGYGGTLAFNPGFAVSSTYSSFALQPVPVQFAAINTFHSFNSFGAVGVNPLVNVNIANRGLFGRRTFVGVGGGFGGGGVGIGIGGGIVGRRGFRR